MTFIDLNISVVGENLGGNLENYVINENHDFSNF